MASVEDVNYEVYIKHPEIYQAFVSNTDEHDIIVETILKQIKNQRKLKILDVGGGPGDLSIKLFKKLIERFDVEFYYLDPNQKYADNFKYLVGKNNLNNFVKKIIIKKWEEFEINEKFDFIFASHSWYGVSNTKKSLLKFREILINNGLGLIIVETPDCLFYKFRDKFFKKIHNVEGTPTSSKDIKNNLSKLKIKFKEEIKSTKINLSKIFNLDEEGKNLLSFLFHKKYDQIPEDIKTEAITFLKNNSKNNIGEMYSSFIWIWK